MACCAPVCSYPHDWNVSSRSRQVPEEEFAEAQIGLRRSLPRAYTTWNVGMLKLSQTRESVLRISIYDIFV